MRAAFVVGVAAGYVLGTRAGRARFDALARTFRRTAARPEVQTAAGVLSAQATALARGALGKQRVGTGHVSPN